MSLCFSSIIKSPAGPDDPKKTLDILDYPDMIAEHYGIHHVELQHDHFVSTETAYLEQYRERLKKAKSQMNQINLEFEQLNISAANPSLRLETIDLTKAWIDHAAILGCPRVMINQGTLAPDVRPAAIETMKAMVAYGKTKKVFITMENRGGGGGAGRGRAGANGAPGAPGRAMPSATMPDGTPRPPRQPGATWEVVAEVLKAAGGYANPDIGNFPDNESRMAGLKVLYTMSSGGSHAHYNPDAYNEADAVRISKEVGYKGLFSIESGRNNGPDPYAAVQMILDELLRDL